MTVESCLGNSWLRNYTSSLQTQNCLLENTEVQSEKKNTGVAKLQMSSNFKNRTCDWSSCCNLCCVLEGDGFTTCYSSSEKWLFSFPETLEALLSNRLWQHPCINMFSNNLTPCNLKDIVGVCRSVCILIWLYTFACALCWRKVSSDVHPNF